MMASVSQYVKHVARQPEVFNKVAESIKYLTNEN